MGYTKDQYWQRPYVEKTRRSVEAEYDSDDPNKGQLERLKSEIHRLSRSLGDYRSQVRTYILAITGAKLAIELGENAIEQSNWFLSKALRILKLAGIDKERSQLAYLYGEQESILSTHHQRCGNHLNASWGQVFSEYVADSKPLTSSEERHKGNLFLRLGDSVRATEHFVLAEGKSRNASSYEKARLCHIKSLRLSGARKKAHYLLAASPSLSEHKLDYQWERALLDDENSVRILFQLSRKFSLPLEKELEFILWVRCVESKQWIEYSRKSKQLYKRYGQTIDDSQSLHALFHSAKIIENLYAKSRQVSQRIKSVGTLLGYAESVPTVEQQLLIYGAVLRWLLRVKRFELASVAQSKYEGLSQQLSQGKNADVLGLCKVSPNGDEPLSNDNQVPTTKPQRFYLASKMGVKCLYQQGILQLQKVFLQPHSPRDFDREKALAFAEVATQYLGQLKGAFMKLGQILSYYEMDLPQEAAVVLAKLQDSCPPHSEKAIRQIIESEFGVPPRKLFGYWEDQPFATGSIGQVHRAVTKDGLEVAVKVQYPDIQEIMQNDLFSLQLLKPILSTALPHFDSEGVFNEIRTRMEEECDYLKEARTQRFFFEKFDEDPDLIVPKVISEFCTKKVLVTERIEGMRFSQFLATADQGQKDRIGQTLLRWHWTCIFRYRYFNADPHPGNYLIYQNKLVCLDFGTAKDWASPEAEGIAQVMEALLLGDDSKLDEAVVLAGMTSTAAGFDFNGMRRAIRKNILGGLTKNESARLLSSTVAADIRECTFHNPEFFKRLKISPENIMLFRNHWGFFSTLAKLEPEINMRQTYEAIKCA